MNWAKNITGMPAGSFRSLAGYAAEQAFIARAMKAGFSLFFKAWRDLEYDAVLDAKGTLFRIEVKSSSGTSFDFTRGGRGGIQIDKSIDKTRPIDRTDCDFVVGVTSEDFTCYIVPVEVIEILGRRQVSLTYLEYFRERWNIFLGGRLQCTPQKIKSGFVIDSDIDIEKYIAKLGISVSDLDSPYKPRGTQRLTIESMKEIMVLRIWEQIGTDPS